MKFDWNKLNMEQKADIAFAFAMFSIVTTFAFAMFSLSLAYSSSVLFVVSLIIFFIGLYLVWRFLKRARQVKGGGPVLAPKKHSNMDWNPTKKDEIDLRIDQINMELQEYEE